MRGWGIALQNVSAEELVEVGEGKAWGEVASVESYKNTKRQGMDIGYCYIVTT